VSSWEAGGQRHFSITVRDITRRKLAEEELKVQARNLEEVNAALKVLLKNREEEKTELEETVMSNLKGLVFPYTEKLKTQLRDQRHLLLLETIETNLNKVVSPFSRRLSSQFYDLTPHEIKIANLIREGKATKEIADLLNATPRAVEFHRNNLRKKLGISNKKTNLRSFLLSFSR
ncbi:MAG: helix-turn-helix transcriptional regulator, partial [Deltaproteobacteria bacterium]|nr:helix-turn-helix transcriptional regulator [Deltaproteobacteria bacterium]